MRELALDLIMNLRGVKFEWNDDQTGIERPLGQQYGFIAQEIMEVLPEKVTMDNLGFYQTAYGDYDPFLVEAIKELDKKLKEKDALIESLLIRLERVERILEVEDLIEKEFDSTANN